MSYRSAALCLFALACSKQAPLTESEVVDAFFAAVDAGDVEAIEGLVAEDYVQHSALAADGRAGLLEALPSLREMEVQRHRLLVDGDKVLLHQTYTLPDQSTQVVFDVFRVEAGQLVEHWDAWQPEVPAAQTVSGRSMTEGPTEVVDLDQTEANRRLVTDFVEVVLTQGQFDRLGEFISADQYDQHNPGVADGLEGLGALAAGLQEAGLVFGYTDSPLVVAQGNFVMVGSEGVFGPSEAPGFALFYDLWRVEQGQIVEHWDVVPPGPDVAGLPHDNGFF